MRDSRRSARPAYPRRTLTTAVTIPTKRLRSGAPPRTFSAGLRMAEFLSLRRCLLVMRLHPTLLMELLTTSVFYLGGGRGGWGGLYMRDRADEREMFWVWLRRRCVLRGLWCVWGVVDERTGGGRGMGLDTSRGDCFFRFVFFFYKQDSSLETVCLSTWTYIPNLPS